MRSGLLRHRVVIERSTEGSANAVGDKPPTWSTLRTIQMSMDAEGGAESFDGAGASASARYVFMTRFPVGITVTPKDRLVLGTRTFDIDSAVDPDGRRRELRITAREKL